MAETNEQVLLGGIRKRLPLDEAVKLTPIGKSLIKLGFSRIRAWLDDEDLVYKIEARRP